MNKKKFQMQKKLWPDPDLDLALALCSDVELLAEKGSGTAADEGKICVVGNHIWRGATKAGNWGTTTTASPADIL
jgi:hypothetical protein